MFEVLKSMYGDAAVMPEEILVPDWHTWDFLNYWLADKRFCQLSTEKVLFLGISFLSPSKFSGTLSSLVPIQSGHPESQMCCIKTWTLRWGSTELLPSSKCHLLDLHHKYHHLCLACTWQARHAEKTLLEQYLVLKIGGPYTSSSLSNTKKVHHKDHY